MPKEDFGDWFERADEEISEKLDALKGKQFKEVREDILRRLQEACESESTKIIRKTINEIRIELKEISSNKGTDLQDKTTIKTKKTGPEAYIPTAKYLMAFEKAMKKPFEKISSEDTAKVTFFVDSVEYNRSPNALFQSVSTNILGFSKIGKGKQLCIHIRNGKTVEEAKNLIENLEKADEVNVNYLLAFEKHAKKILEKMNAEDATPINFKIGSVVLKRSPSALFDAVSRHILNLRSCSKGKQLCIYLRDGKTPAEAKKLIEDAENLNEANQAYMLEFEKGAKLVLEKMSPDDTKKIDFEVASVKLKRSPCALFEDIARKMLNTLSRPKAKQFCIYLRDGKTPTEAKKLIEDAQKLNEVNSTYLFAFQKAAKTKLENMRIDDSKPIKFTIGSVEMERSPNALFVYLAKNFLGSATPAKGRQFCIYVRDGKAPSEAKKLIELHEDASNVNQEYLLAFERGAKKALEKFDPTDLTPVTFTIGSVEQKRSPNALFSTISMHILGKKNASAGKKICIYVRDGKSAKMAKNLLELGNEGIEDDEFEKISKLKLEEVIAFYRGQEGGAMKFKIWLYFAHPELSEVERNKLIIRSFKELYGASGKKEEEYLKWETKLKTPLLSTNPPGQTKKNTITLTGRALGSQDIYISGAWTRRVKTESDGTFSVPITLRIGQRNEIRIMGIDRDKKIRSEQQTFEVMQNGKPEDIESLIRLLEDLGESLTKQISEDPGRQEFLAECTERLLIKKFSKSFEDGQEYVQKLLEKTTHPVLKRIIKRVMQNFEWIKESNLPNVKEEELLFFQKFCAYKIRQAMNTPGRKGINLCNDPGLGKTRTVLAAIADLEAAIFSPNSIVTAWKREAEKSLIDPDLLVLNNTDHKERKQKLKNNPHKRIVTNVQFLQNTEDQERFNLIGGERKIAVFDEAHSRKNQHSEQSKGAKMVPHRFAINVTATLARNPTELRRMLLTLEPDKKEFQSDQAFQRAFPSSDPDALRQLKLIVDQYSIRFRKHDVLEEIDADLPLEDQLHRLPGKERMPPDILGKFDMTEKQAKAIYEMFKDWQAWCRKYDKYIPKDELARQDGLRKESGLSKLHAYRQIINNPSYINDRSGEDPKLEQNMRIIRKSLREGRKIVVFCLYEAQAQKYAQVLSKYHPSLYTGQTSDKGLIKDEKTGKPKLLSLDEKGLPFEDPNGEPMTALDYEWQTFQSMPDRKILISTYSAGSVGTTFTAGKTTIYDDLPRDCKEDIQAEDRTHRIDPDHQTHATVQYYQMQARYPERFLEQMKKIWVVKDPETKVFEEFKKKEDAVRHAKALETDETGPIDVTTAYDRFFAQGTYDQVHSQNLLNQRTMFHLINDGIADEAELKKEDIPFAGLENGKTEEVLERDRDAE